MTTDLDELERLYGPAVYFDADARGKIINAMPALIAELRALREVAAAGRIVDKQDWDTLLEDCDPEAHPEEAADALNSLRAALAKVPR